MSKLPNDIRNLPHRKRLHRDRLLKSACHEAAHTLYALRHGIAFLEVRVGREALENYTLHSDDTTSTSVEIGGRFIPDPAYEYYRSSVYPTGHGWDDAARLSLAGHAFEQIVDPHHGDLYLFLMGSMNDYKQAIEVTKWGLYMEECASAEDGREVEDIIDKRLVPPVRKFLIENWESVIRLGELLKERKSLTPEEVKQAVQ